MNYYTGNLDKIITEKEGLIGRLRHEDKDIDIRIQKFVDDYNVGLAEHRSLLQKIEDAVEQRNLLSQQIFSTDELVLDCVEARRLEIERLAQEELRMEEVEAQQLQNEKKEQKMNDEFDRMRASFNKYGEFFQQGENGERWYAKPRLLQTVTLLDKKKDLEQRMLAMRLKRNEIEERNRRLRDQLDTLKSANKNQTKEDITNLDYLEGRIDELEQTKSEVKQSVKNFFHFLDGEIQS